MSMASLIERTELTALLCCPDRTLAQQFSLAISDVKALNIVADLKEYPSVGALEEHIRQSRPDAVLLDVGTNRETAMYLLSQLVSAYPAVPVIGLNRSNEPETILQCLRSGVAEFLPAPFQVADTEQAIRRLVRRKEASIREEPQRGRLIAFVPSKGGSGATTTAANMAHVLARISEKRVLLADFDLVSGTVAFLYRLSHNYSLLDAIRHSHQLDASMWSSLVAPCHGIDVLPAPEKAHRQAIEPHRVHECLEYARSIYDYLVVDLASLADKVALATVNETDELYLVTSPDLPALFLARKTITLLEEMGFRKNQVRVVLNRYRRRDELSLSDMEKIFRSPVFATFPDDHENVRRSLTEGRPVADGSDLGKSYRRFVEGVLSGRKPDVRAPVSGPKAALSTGVP